MIRLDFRTKENLDLLVFFVERTVDTVHSSTEGALSLHGKPVDILLRDTFLHHRCRFVWREVSRFSMGIRSTVGSR